MKKISAFLIIMIAMLMAGVCAHAAEFSVDTTSLPMGEAYKPYSAQITMTAEARTDIVLNLYRVLNQQVLLSTRTVQ